MNDFIKAFERWLHTPCILGVAAGLLSMLFTYIMDYPFSPYEGCATRLVIPGLISFLGTYFLVEATRTMEKLQKQRFLIKFVVIFLACMLVAYIIFNM
jgi:hypothetical protein